MIKFIKDIFISVPLVLSLLFVGISLFLSFIYLSLPSDINLITKFESTRGIRDFGSLLNILLTTTIVFLYIIINTLISWFIYNKKRQISYLLSFTSLFISLLLLIYVGVIIGIN